MIIKRLRDTYEMTAIERGIAEYILKNSELVIKMTAKELAEATYTSQSSVLRLCKGIDEKGFADFKLKLALELKEMRNEKLSININRPFIETDSFEEIADKISDIGIASIKETKENLNFNEIKRITTKIRECRVIDIYGMGNSQTIAMDFKDKMIRIGKDVRLELANSNQYYQALNSDKTHFAILISHSGMTKEVLGIADILRERKVLMLGITSEGENDLVTYTNYSIRTVTTEEKFLLHKIDNMGSQVAVKYILDCLFSWLYESQFEDNYSITQKNEIRLKEMRLR